VRFDETSFRGLLDPRGLLPESAAGLIPSGDRAFTVFAQRPDARIDVAEWQRHAERFFDTRLGLTVDKHYEGAVPRTDGARVVLVPKVEDAPSPGSRGVRLCWARPRTDADVQATMQAITAGAGLVELANRCNQTWLVEIEEEDDLVALRLSAILASVMLGPILSPRATALFGPKTARERLSSLA
jgi:hypothetical protein